MEWLTVRNWDRWQSYRNDRPPPPWIKVHRRLLMDPDFLMLEDAEKAALLCLWITAADRNGLIPNNAKLLQKITGLDVPPDLEKFQALGFLEVLTCGCQDDANLTPNGCQDDAPEAEAEAEAKAKAKAETERERSRDGVRFRAPTLEEIEQVCAEKHYTHVDPEDFFNFYASKGWMVGKNRMKSLPHALARWEKRNAENWPPRGGRHPPKSRNDIHREIYRELIAEDMDAGAIREVSPQVWRPVDQQDRDDAGGDRGNGGGVGQVSVFAKRR